MDTKKRLTSIPIVAVAAIVLAFAGMATAQTRAGGEFRVNAHTTSQQFNPDMAMEPDGDFVVVWQSNSQDGSGEGIFGQRYAANGAPRGSEFQVNTNTPFDQMEPSVAAGSKGDFVVVWQGVQDGSATSIQGQRFDAAGGPVGAEFGVNTFTTGNQLRPRVARATDGQFVVAWTSQDRDGGLYGIAARRFTAAGDPVGDEFLVNTATTHWQRWGEPAFDAAGNLVIVWEDARDGGFTYGIFGQRYSAAGSPLGTEFQVNDTTGFRRRPYLSVFPAGGFVVSWTGQAPGDGSDYAIFAKRFDAAGMGLGNEFVVNTYTTGNQFYGQVASDALGNFVVSWYGPGDGNGFGAFGQRFSASGVRRGGEFQVNTFTPQSSFRPVAASDAVGNFVVAWDQTYQDGSGYGIYAQRFGGLTPAALAVDAPPGGNNVLEPGETVVVAPTWRNTNGAAQTLAGGLANIAGPAGATYAITDAAADYGTVANAATGACTDCYAVLVSNPPTRPALHWDATAVEGILPDAQGQQKQWRLHVGRSFADVPVTHTFYRFIETLLHHGVSSGCTGTAYCPDAATTRDQMAVFVLVAKEGTGYVPPACTTPVFGDVPASSPFCRWIEELARRGVVGGCGGGNYCPSSAVTREQMAVFVLRTLEPALTPPACAPPNLYGDVPETSPFCRWIEELTRRGVVSGCGAGNYCPTAAVTRDQMGVFMSVTFGLVLYGP